MVRQERERADRGPETEEAEATKVRQKSLEGLLATKIELESIKGVLMRDRKYLSPKWARILLGKKPPLLDKGGG
jgi:hypothetical protein